MFSSSSSPSFLSKLIHFFRIIPLQFHTKLSRVLLALFIVLTTFLIYHHSFFIFFSSPPPHLQVLLQQTNDRPRAPTVDEIKQLQGIVDNYDPRTAVAFAIPVGGRTERSLQLEAILLNLLNGGAPASNIFIFEDVLGRPGAINNEKVAAMAQRYNVPIINSLVSRADMPESHANFGIHLARHYHFMLDWLLFTPDTNDKTATPLSESPTPYPAKPFEFAVLIEDDLDLAPDFVKFFYSMSKVMRVDPTLYCASAHQDNAFYGTSHESGRFDPLGFDFRRGNHFMAPGWMTSRDIYTSVVRPMWLDAQGEYAFKNQLHLRNGHWDRFFDSRIGQRDCLFPEVPRITHNGADGFTVDKKGQMELYANLKLSNVSKEVDYGDLQRLTKDGYVESQRQFIKEAKLLHALEEIRQYRNTKLVYVVQSKEDKDEVWNTIIASYFGLIGVGGYGGFEGYVKVRGIFNGAVFVRWLTNLILLVGAYSPYMDQVDNMQVAGDTIELTYAGCYADTSDRDLPYLLRHHPAASLSPYSCLSSCNNLGYKYAGLQDGVECWCGNSYGKHGLAEGGDLTGCSTQCGGAKTNTVRKTKMQKGDSIHCGGAWKNSVYWNSKAPNLFTQALAPPDDVKYVVGQVGQSCDDACRSARIDGKQLKCNEQYFPLLHRSCPILQSLLSCKSCHEEEDIARGIYSPGGNEQKCALSKGRYFRCAAKPEGIFRRACVCQIV